MARPKRLNAEYFSHDSGMRDDPKIKALRNKFGITGYAVWCMMLEILTNSDHFKRSIDDIEIEILSADFGIDPELFSEILAYMLRLKLLQIGDSGEYLSQKLTDRLQPVVDKRRNSCRKVVSVTESTQSKVKKTKVKESKVDNKEPVIELPPFICPILWKEFLVLRAKIKAQNTESALRSLIKKLSDMESKKEGSAKISIEESIMNSWKGVFEPKGSYSKPLSTSPVSTINHGDVF